jgi:hypothetical protein
MPLTNAIKAAVLDALYGKQTLTVPDTLYVGLSTTPPNPDGTGFTEPSGGGYARVAVQNDGTHWYAATQDNPSIKANALPILFPEATADWGTVTHWGIFDAAEGGAVIDWAPLTTSFNVVSGQQPQFREGDLQTRLQNA